MSKYIQYIEGAWESARPTLVILSTVISYVIFPREAYKTAAIGLAGAMALDVVTKYYALAKTNGGLWRAITSGHIRSYLLWEGTARKVVSYLVVMILAGLSIRVSPLEQLAIFFSTIVYAIMFLRESSSVIENLIHAGHSEWEWLLLWLRKQESENIKKALKKKIEIIDFKKG